MKIFKTSQIREIDLYTIQHEPVDSYELMMRASCAFVDEILPFLEYGRRVCVFAGPGDNGGDALVAARMLLLKGQSLHVFLVNPQNRLSPPWLFRRRLS